MLSHQQFLRATHRSQNERVTSQQCGVMLGDRFTGPATVFMPDRPWDSLPTGIRSTCRTPSSRTRMHCPAYAGQRIGKRWLWYVEGRNLTGRKYAATTGMARTLGGADGPQFLPGDGRSFHAGLQWQL